MKSLSLLLSRRSMLLSCSIAALAQLSAGQAPTAPSGQDPASTRASTPASTVRLVYELPVDALQRTLLQHPEHNMEQLVTTAVATITARLGSDAKVMRNGAAGFTVEPSASSPAALAAIRARIEYIGKLEFRLLANASYEPVDLQLQQERQRLQDWLAKGGLEKLRKDPSSLAQFQPEHPEHIRWAARRVDPTNKARNYLISDLDAGREATVTTFTPEQWRSPPADFGHMLELIAINLHAQSFSSSDLDSSRTKLAKGRMMTAVNYYLNDDRKEAYDEWSAANAGQCCAALLDDEVLAAPTLRAAKGGRGMLAGKFNEATISHLQLAILSKPLPVMPKLLRQEPAASDPQRIPGKVDK